MGQQASADFGSLSRKKGTSMSKSPIS